MSTQKSTKANVKDSPFSDKLKLPPYGTSKAKTSRPQSASILFKCKIITMKCDVLLMPPSFEVTPISLIPPTLLNAYIHALHTLLSQWCLSKATPGRSWEHPWRFVDGIHLSQINHLTRWIQINHDWSYSLLRLAIRKVSYLIFKTFFFFFLSSFLPPKTNTLCITTTYTYTKTN